MELMTPLFVQNESWFQEWLPIRRKAIFGAEAGPGMVAMLCPPFRQTGSTQFDHQLRITDPFQLLPGGYISVYDITSGTGWQQISRPLPQPAAFVPQRAPIGSRRDRRRTPRNQWVRSAADAGRR